MSTLRDSSNSINVTVPRRRARASTTPRRKESVANRHQPSSSDEQDQQAQLPLTLEGDRYGIFYCKGSRGDRDRRGPKGEDYYYVGAIVKARPSKESATGREFLIKWSDFPPDQNTWEPEPNLNGCVIAQNDFCRKNKIRPALIEPVVGGAIDGDHNESNFISINLVKSWIKREVGSTVPVEIFLGQPISANTLALVPLDSHCYVVFVLEDLCVVADGRDWYAEGSDERIDDYFANYRRVSSIYGRQLGFDDCGTSAVMIGIDLIRRFKRGVKEIGDWRKPIDVCPSTLNRVTQALRKGPTLRINEGAGSLNNWSKRKWLRCECGWSAQTTKGNALNAHKRFQCPNKKSTE